MLNITMPRQALLKASQTALKPVLPNPQHEIFKCFHLSAKGNLLTIEGSDMSMSVLAQCSFPGQPHEVISRLCIPAKQFHDVLSKFTQPEVSLTQQDGGLLLACGRAKAVLNVVNAANWPPELDEARGGPVLEISAAKLKSALNKVLWAGREEGDQPKSRDLMMQLQDHWMRLGATDTKTLAMCEVKDFGVPSTRPLNATLQVDMSIMLPLKFAKRIEQVLEDDDKQAVQFVLHQGRLHVTISTTKLWMPLSTELVPRYPTLDVILGDSPWVGKVSKPDLVASLELVKAGSGKGDEAMHSTTILSKDPGVLRVLSGQASDECEFEGEPLSLHVQIATDDMLAALKAAPGLDITLSKGPGPLVIQAGADPLWAAFITPRGT